MRPHTIAPLVVAALIVTACAGDDDASSPADTTAADASTVTEPNDDTEPTTAPTAPPETAPPTTVPPTTSPPTTVPPTTQPAADWVPVEDGAYDVGVTTVTVDPAGDRPLTVEVWFPLDDGADVASLAPHPYTLIPGAVYESPSAFSADASLLGAGPFPLVVYSHGAANVRFLHSSYLEALASHGYVVVAPDHTGNTVFDFFTGVQSSRDENAYNRPRDVQRLIDAFTAPDDPVAGPFARSVDADSVVVTGYSVGGYSAIATVTGATTPIGEIVADPRVDAVVPLAPAVGDDVLTDDVLGRLDVPFMVVAGTDDQATPIEPNVTRLWDLAPGVPAYRVELVGAVHTTFTEFCAYLDALPGLPDIPELILTTVEEFAGDACDDDVMSVERASELTHGYVIRFLDEIFRGGDPIDPSVMATPDDVILDSR